jgi:hypothetical protein
MSFGDTAVDEDVLGETDSHAHCREDQVLITFNLLMLLNDQLKQAKEMLSMQQKHYLHKQTGVENPKKLIRKRHFNKWPWYLRALDARESGATLYEIGVIAELEGYAKNDGEGANLTERLGQQIADAAKELQFNFPF